MAVGTERVVWGSASNRTGNSMHTCKESLLTSPCICDFTGLQLRSQDSSRLLFQQTKAELQCVKRTALNGMM